MRYVLTLMAAMFLMLALSTSPVSAAPPRGMQAKQRIGLIARIRQFEQRKQAWFRSRFGR